MAKDAGTYRGPGWWDSLKDAFPFGLAPLIILCLTIVGIPFGIQCFKLAELSLLPFGRRFETDSTAAGAGCLGTVMNVVWFLVAGLWIFLSHVGLGLAAAVTIIGIPFALQHLKLALLALAPFGKRVVDQ